MLRPISQNFPHHSDQILEQLNVQRYYAAFCDITVRVEDVDFKLHKCVLAASCAKLQGMLFNMRPECGNILTLKDLSLNGFRCVVEYIYTGMLKLDSMYVHDILAASQFFEIREIEKYCLDFFKNSRTETQLPPLRTALQGILGMGGGSATPSSMHHHHHAGMLASSHPSSIQAPFPGPAFVPAPMPHPAVQSPLQLPHQLQPQPSNAAFDTNYIEDYFKLIETLQGDPNQLAAVSMPTLQQNISTAVLPPNPATVAYKEPVKPLKPAGGSTSNRPDSSYVELAAPAATVGKPVNALPANVMPISSTTMQCSADDVQRTVMNVLAQERFDDDCIPATTQAECDSTKSSESMSLTSLLTIGSTKKLNDSVGEEAGDVPGTVEDKQDIAINMKEEEEEDSSCSDDDNLVVNEDGSSCSDRQEEQANSSGEENGQDSAIKKETEPTSTSPKSGVSERWSKKEHKRQKRKKKTPVKLAEQNTQPSESEEEPHVESVGSSYKHFKTTNRCVKPLKKRKVNMKKKIKCDKCGREFGKKELLDRHMLLHTNIIMYSCHVCGHKYARAGELTRHMRVHALDDYKCPHCQLKVRSPALFKRHMELMHHEAKAFICTFPGCGFKSDKPSNVEKHAVIHSNVKAYSCSECGKHFSQPNGLRSHLRSCQQQRRYLCDICGAKFNHLQSMKSHRMLHTGEKPYQCIDCNARFTDHRNFKRHRRIHENLYPYPCMQCDKRFRHSNSLKAHSSTHLNKLLAPPELMMQQFQNL